MMTIFGDADIDNDGNIVANDDDCFVTDWATDGQTIDEEEDYKRKRAVGQRDLTAFIDFSFECLKLCSF